MAKTSLKNNNDPETQVMMRAALALKSRTLLSYDESYFEYVADPLPWHSAGRRCQRRRGALATVSSVFETRELTSYLDSLNISQPVWVARKASTQLKSSLKTLILEFSGHSDQQNARLLHKFRSMGSVTVCTRLQFDPSCSGVSTVFSYSIQAFQLRATMTGGQPVKLALLVHGQQGPYQEAFRHDGAWHSVCVSWNQHGGQWALFADGAPLSKGDRLYSADSIGPDGLFIIGKEQDTLGGSFKKDESFSGNITQLNIWERVLSDGEIHSMEKECSPVSSGLVFKWSGVALEMEPSLRRLWGDLQCRGNSSELAGEFLNFSSAVANAPNPEQCVTFDPVVSSWSLDACESSRGGSSRFMSHLFNPSWPVLASCGVLQVMEEASVNVSSRRDSAWLVRLTAALLGVLESHPDLLTSGDVRHLCQMMEQDVAAAATATATPPFGDSSSSTELLVSVATNYLKLASLILEPRLAAQWMAVKEDGVNVGPFVVVESIDKLTAVLADALSGLGKSFTLSTQNIDVHMEARTLSQVRCSCVFKPSSIGTHHSSSSQDELLIPDTEVQRLHSLGFKDVMFIHTYYTHLMEIQAAMKEEQDIPSGVPGQLTTAVISATVRDSSRAQSIPVAVQYTLSSSHVTEDSHRVTPLCAFWNFSLMHGGYCNSWSSDGCRVTYSSPDVTSCFCNHTTNFAVLMNYMESKWSPEEELVLTKLTFIGSGASLCALAVTLMLFTVLDLPQSDRTSIHRNLLISLTCAQVLLLCSGSAVNSKVACTLVAALLHLFFMAAFSWMLVEGLLLWSKVVTVNLSEDTHMKYYYLIGWGLPVLIVTITLASASGRYAATGRCWLSVQDGVIWGFAGPVLFIITVNIMVLTRVVFITISTAKRRSIMLAMGSSPVEQTYEQIRAAVKAVLVLLPILGLTWLCGVLVPFSIVMAYIFVLLNSLQGLFIFLMYGVYNTEVRSTVNRLKERRKALHFSNCASSRPSSSITSSRPASSPVPGPGPPETHTPSQEEAPSPLASPCYPHPHSVTLGAESDNHGDHPTTERPQPGSLTPQRAQESWSN
ncbi:adhesion G protein-coupled receptor D2 [Aplochiton taeniatus]